MTRKQFSEVRLGTPAPHHRGKGKCRKRGVRAPLCRLERCWSFLSLAAHFGAPSTSAFDVWSLGAGVPCRPRSRNLQGASRWLGGEGYGRPGLALGPPFSFPHSFFLSCLLLWPEEMEWAGGGPLSSHPLPEPKSGVTLPPPRARPGEKLALQGKCLEPLPELGPSALPPRSPAQSLRASPLPPFRPLFWKEQSHSAWPCPCSCPSCHIVLPLPREATPPHQAALS